MEEFYENVQNIMFKNVDDLYLRREKIRKEYLLLDYSTKQIYKWFFYYQLCMLRNPLKRLLWEYINEINAEAVQKELCEEYKKFCVKRHKIYPGSQFDIYD